MRSIFIALLCVFLGIVVASTATAQSPTGPSVREVVEFKQIIEPANQNDDALHEQISADGKQAFIVTRQADVSNDKNVYEILRLDVAPEHLATHREPHPEVLLSVAVDHDNNGVLHAIQDVRWHGDRTLVFMARLAGNLYQVYSLDVSSRKLVQLTHESNLIMSYAVSQDLQRVVYAALVPNPPLKKGAHGVVVGNQSFWGVKFGQHDLLMQDLTYQYFVSDTASPRSPRPLGSAFADRNGLWPTVSLSPDGRWAVLPRWEPDRLVTWEREYPMVSELSRQYAFAQRGDPLGYFSRPVTYVPRRMTAWRLDEGTEQAIVDAPDDTIPGGSQLRTDSLWQGTGQSVVLTGTHLPIEPGRHESLASHVIEYWPDTARWTTIATLQARLKDVHALPNGFLLVDGERRREFHRLAGGGWREAGDATPVPDESGPTWTLHIVQGLNQPPDVYASGPSGANTRLTLLNPQFNTGTWGKMQPYSWRDATGAQWNGGLLAANDLDTHAPHPLVIQTYGFSPDRFYLDGPNRADGATSAFAGRAFLREGILVLAIPLNPKGVVLVPRRLAQQAFDRSIRSAVDALVKEGRVDPAKVGIIGWSNTGQRVLNLITFDDVPIRAATMADGDANTMFSLAVTYGSADAIWAAKEEMNEGMPYRDGLARWVRNDPSMHTDCIRSAVRIESYSPLVLNNWDIYALLRRQYKAAAMVVIPDGRHELGMPGDRMVSLQGNVDWYGFWLAGKTRAAPLLASETAESVAAQYAQWRQMEELKTADDARPRCVR